MGIVHDATGADVGGAMVTLTNEGTGISFTTETSESGAYSFDLVQVGRYSVTIEKQGFKKFLSQGNSINVNLPTTISTILETGGVAETVTVQAAGEQVQTSTSGNLGTTIETTVRAIVHSTLLSMVSTSMSRRQVAQTSHRFDRTRIQSRSFK